MYIVRLDPAEPLMRKLLLIGVLVLLFQISTVTTMAVSTNNSEGKNEDNDISTNLHLAYKIHNAVHSRHVYAGPGGEGCREGGEMCRYSFDTSTCFMIVMKKSVLIAFNGERKQ